MITVRLPWPDKDLLPNARVERYHHAEVVKRHRQIGKIYTLNTQQLCLLTPGDALHIGWEYHPPDRRHRDYDGMISSCKAYQDGVFDALGLNDHQIVSGEFYVGEMVKDGVVIVTLKAAGLP